MKYLITFIFITFSLHAFCQFIPKEQPQTTANPAPVKKKPAKPQKQGGATEIIKMLPDADCTVYVDGERKGSVIADNILKIPLVKGSYIIKAVGTNPADVLNQDYTVENVGTETIFRISLQPIIAARIERQNAAEQSRNATNIAVVYVQGGSFDMGSNDALDFKAQPVHRVTLSSFYIGKYEVTQAQWKAIMGNNPSNFQNCDDCPVEQVSWDDVQGFIEKLNQKTGKHYRLPTEAEWEYAAKGGGKSSGYNYSGSNDLSSVAWYADNSGSKTQSKGQKQANELGIYDMSGNVWEWCQDWFAADYYSNSPAENPQGPATGSYRVYRGGSWNDAAPNCRVARRDRSTPGSRYDYLGFRLVLVP